MRHHIVLALFLSLALAPALLAPPTAEACQPLSWWCPLNQRYYYSCGTQVPPPIVTCALDTVRDLHLPPLP